MRFERTPSIRTCFPERFSESNSEESVIFTNYNYSGSFSNKQSRVRSPADGSLSLSNVKVHPRLESSTTPHFAVQIDDHIHTKTIAALVPDPGPSASPSASFLRVGNSRDVPHLTLYVPLYQAAMKGDWGKAEEFLNQHPGALSVRITKGWETALHIAAGAKHSGFVEEAVKLMSETEIALRNKNDNTALCYAAASGITRSAEVMIKKNKKLPLIRGNKGVTPIHMAALFGHRDMVAYLYNVTPSKLLTQEDHIGLLTAAIRTDLLDIALCILESQPELATMRDPNGETALHVLARKPSVFTSHGGLGMWQRFVYPWICVHQPCISSCITSSNHSLVPGILEHLWRSALVIVPGFKVVHEKKLQHLQAVKLLKVVWEQILSIEDSKIADLLRSPSHPLFLAAEFGIVEIAVELIKCYPDLIWRVDDQSRSIFHLAVIHRQEKIFNLIHDIEAYKDMITSYKDDKNRNILHLAGKLAPSNRLKTVSGTALQMQRELLWFKEVEKNISPLYREMRDADGSTPWMLFTEKHSNLVKEGEKWMKNTASSCMLVATLITTVMFAAIFTVPGGNDNQKGIPIFVGAKSFIIWGISDAFALFSSVTSILMFLSILTSRYAEEDFTESLPKRLIIGLTTLFISIASMLVAFGATFFIVLGHQLAWIVIPIALVACIPVTLFAFL